VDTTVIPFMTDEQLQRYVPKYGDMLAVRHFVNSRSKGEKSDERNCSSKDSVIQRLRKKLRMDKGSSSCDDNEVNKRNQEGSSLIPGSPHPYGRVPRLKGNSNAVKETRSIQLGWIETNCGIRKQVKPKYGGGVRKVTVDKKFKVNDLLKLAQHMFFPNGVSKKGNVNDFNCSLCDFKEQEISESSTVEDMFNAAKMNTLRCDIFTTCIGVSFDVTSLSSDDSLPDLFTTVLRRSMP